jgi:acyl carrier protein
VALSAEQQVLSIVERAIRAEPGTVRPDARLDTLEGWDSMGVVDVLGTLYDTFGVVLTMDELATFRTVADVVARVAPSR